MTRFRARHVGLAVGSLALLAGCSTTTVLEPPPELVKARAEFGSASSGAAAKYAPAELQEAGRALDRAETFYKAQPESPATRAQAYAALRQVQAAEASAGTKMANAQREGAAQAALQAQAQRATTAEDDLRRAHEEVERMRCAQQGGTLSSCDGACTGQDRADVINLPGAAYFTEGQADVSAAARANLNAVAQALKTNRCQVRIEGFTDSTGSDATNNRLSDARAETVRGYLVLAGVDASRIRVEGMGASLPVGNNDTPQGRAANRRVSIVIEPIGVAERQR